MHCAICSSSCLLIRSCCDPIFSYITYWCWRASQKTLRGWGFKCRLSQLSFPGKMIGDSGRKRLFKEVQDVFDKLNLNLSTTWYLWFVYFAWLKLSSHIDQCSGNGTCRIIFEALMDAHDQLWNDDKSWWSEPEVLQSLHKYPILELKRGARSPWPKLMPIYFLVWVALGNSGYNLSRSRMMIVKVSNRKNKEIKIG